MPSNRLFIGRLHPSARERDLERLFRNCGRIRDIMLKRGYAFVELDDPRDAEDAVYDLTGKEVMGERITVELARGTPHGRDKVNWGHGGGGGRGHDRSPPREKRRRSNPRSRSRSPRGRDEKEKHTEFKVTIENLSSKVSTRGLKEAMAEAGEVVFAEVTPDKREGVVEYATYDELKNALATLQGKDIKGREIRLQSDYRAKSGSVAHSRSRSFSGSRSPAQRSRSRSGSGEHQNGD